MMDHDLFMQAKCVVLGDHNTGKSSLISSLAEANKQASGEAFNLHQQNEKHDDVIFRSVIVPSSDLQGTKSNLQLKIWEYSSHLSKEETELILRGALFCIITFDIRNPESANSAFNSWLLLKETFMTESFLFIVGTHLDYATSRRVEVNDLCKACAQKDAIYIETSCTKADGTNILLLRKLLLQRINFMIGIKDEIHRQKNDNSGAGGDSDDELGDTALKQSEELQKRHRKLYENVGDSTILDTTFLEQEIISESVGSILASALGTEFWPGYQTEQENLKKIGSNICNHVRELAMDPSSAPNTPLEFVLQSVPPPSASQADSKTLPLPEISELKHVFEIMGFQLPQSLLQPTAPTASDATARSGTGTGSGSVSGDNTSIAGSATSSTANAKNAGAGTSANSKGKSVNANSNSNSTGTIRLKVALPKGGSTEIQIYPGYHVGRQVETFLVQHGLEDDDDARFKLTRAAEQIAKKHFKNKE